MMPHARCQRSGCWLDSFFAIQNLSLPKFHLGQRVFREYVSSDDGQTYVDRGIVMGFFLAPHRWLEGWWYCVSWDVLPQVTWLSLPHLEEAHEDDLQLIEEGNN